MEGLMESITVTRGLAELKLLDSRIGKTINVSLFVDCFQEKNKKTLIASKVVAEFEKDAKSQYDSVKDLIKRRANIKTSIMKSNSVTIVDIGEKKMTVMEAIELKNSINYDKQLLTQLRTQLTQVKDAEQSNSSKLEDQIQTLVEQSLGSDKKTSPEDYNNIAGPLLKANNLNTVDPIGIEKVIKDLDNYIDTFETECDFILSESNAKTEIELN